MRSLHNPVYAVTGAILLVVLLLFGVALWQYWSTIFKDAQTRAATLGYLLAEQTTRTFQAVDLTLRGLEPFLENPALPDHAPAFEKLLDQRVGELDYIDAIAVADASGRVTQLSDPSHQVPASLADVVYFKAFAQDPNLTFLIGHPLSSRPGLVDSIPVIRRIGPPSRLFAGIIVASVEPKYFGDFYRNLDLGPHASIDLYLDNGTVLLASSKAEPPSVTLPRFDSEPHFGAGLNFGHFSTQIGEVHQQCVAFRRTQGYPLVVAVGIDFADLRSQWWHAAAPTLGALAALAALAVALAILFARRLEERQRARNRAMMMQKLEALGQMTASVSHDFRNLLTVMTSTLRLLRRRGPDETVLAAAEEAIERGNGLVTQLLAFSKRHALELRPADVNALLTALVGVLRHAAGSGIALDIDLAPELPPCRTDQTQFDAALMNLVVNARQAMPQGGAIAIATRRVTRDASAEQGFVELRVSDTGCGIAPSDMKRIFEPFFTTKAETGTGLGLSQVHEFMRQIGGDVTVSSVVGAGTTFCLLFPVAADATTCLDPQAASKAA